MGGKAQARLRRRKAQLKENVAVKPKKKDATVTGSGSASLIPEEMTQKAATCKKKKNPSAKAQATSSIASQQKKDDAAVTMSGSAPSGPVKQQKAATRKKQTNHSATAEAKSSTNRPSTEQSVSETSSLQPSSDPCADMSVNGVRKTLQVSMEWVVSPISVDDELDAAVAKFRGRFKSFFPADQQEDDAAVTMSGSASPIPEEITQKAVTHMKLRNPSATSEATSSTASQQKKDDAAVTMSGSAPSGPVKQQKAATRKKQTNHSATAEAMCSTASQQKKDDAAVTMSGSAPVKQQKAATRKKQTNHSATAEAMSSTNSPSTVQSVSETSSLQPSSDSCADMSVKRVWKTSQVSMEWVVSPISVEDELDAAVAKFRGRFKSFFPADQREDDAAVTISGSAPSDPVKQQKGATRKKPTNRSATAEATSSTDSPTAEQSVSETSSLQPSCNSSADMSGDRVQKTSQVSMDWVFDPMAVGDDLDAAVADFRSRVRVFFPDSPPPEQSVSETSSFQLPSDFSADMSVNGVQKTSQVAKKPPSPMTVEDELDAAAAKLRGQVELFNLADQQEDDASVTISGSASPIPEEMTQKAASRMKKKKPSAKAEATSSIASQQKKNDGAVSRSGSAPSGPSKQQKAETRKKQKNPSDTAKATNLIASQQKKDDAAVKMSGSAPSGPIKQQKAENCKKQKNPSATAKATNLIASQQKKNDGTVTRSGSAAPSSPIKQQKAENCKMQKNPSATAETMSSTSQKKKNDGAVTRSGSAAPSGPIKQQKAANCKKQKNPSATAEAMSSTSQQKKNDGAVTRSGSAAPSGPIKQQKAANCKKQKNPSATAEAMSSTSQQKKNDGAVTRSGSAAPSGPIKQQKAANCKKQKNPSATAEAMSSTSQQKKNDGAVTRSGSAAPSGPIKQQKAANCKKQKNPSATAEATSSIAGQQKADAAVTISDPIPEEMTQKAATRMNKKNPSAKVEASSSTNNPSTEQSVSETSSSQPSSDSPADITVDRVQKNSQVFKKPPSPITVEDELDAAAAECRQGLLEIINLRSSTHSVASKRSLSGTTPKLDASASKPDSADLSREMRLTPSMQAGPSSASSSGNDKEKTKPRPKVQVNVFVTKATESVASPDPSAQAQQRGPQENPLQTAEIPPRHPTGTDFPQANPESAGGDLFKKTAFPDLSKELRMVRKAVKPAEPMDCEITSPAFAEEPTPLVETDLYVVVDTNVLIGNLSLIRSLKTRKIKGMTVKIIIPWQVLKELNYLKDSETGTEYVVRRARSGMRYLLKEMSESDFISGQPQCAALKVFKFFVKNPDDQVIKCCLQLKSDGREVILLSNDRRLVVKGLKNAVGSIECREFIECCRQNEATGRLTPFEIPPPYEEDPLYNSSHKLTLLLKVFLNAVLSKFLEDRFLNSWLFRIPGVHPWSLTTMLETMADYWHDLNVKEVLLQLRQFIDQVMYDRLRYDDVDQFARFCHRLAMVMPPTFEDEKNIFDNLLSFWKWPPGTNVPPDVTFSGSCLYLAVYHFQKFEDTTVDYCFFVAKSLGLQFCHVRTPSYYPESVDLGDAPMLLAAVTAIVAALGKIAKIPLGSVVASSPGVKVFYISIVSSLGEHADPRFTLEDMVEFCNDPEMRDIFPQVFESLDVLSTFLLVLRKALD